jgi:hypothetical protein
MAEATLEEVRAQLGELHVRCEIVTGGHDGSRGLNVWADPDTRYPSTSAYGPGRGFPDWSWGDQFEHRVDANASAEIIAAAIKATL